jgi:hypothetical protein
VPLISIPSTEDYGDDKDDMASVTGRSAPKTESISCFLLALSNEREIKK